jgi:hypothetical protein
MWRMFHHFRRRLRGVVTFHAVNRLGSINTAILRDVIDVAKLHGA